MVCEYWHSQWGNLWSEDLGNGFLAYVFCKSGDVFLWNLFRITSMHLARPYFSLFTVLWLQIQIQHCSVLMLGVWISNCHNAVAQQVPSLQPPKTSYVMRHQPTVLAGFDLASRCLIQWAPQGRCSQSFQRHVFSHRETTRTLVPQQCWTTTIHHEPCLIMINTSSQSHSYWLTIIDNSY